MHVTKEHALELEKDRPGEMDTMLTDASADLKYVPVLGGRTIAVQHRCTVDLYLHLVEKKRTGVYALILPHP